MAESLLTGTPTAAPPTGAQPALPAGAAPPRLSLAGLLVTPALLVAACVALYVYIQGKQLDSIEQRLINREILTEAFIRHIQLVAVSTVLVIAIAVPLGVLLTRPGIRRFSSPVLVVANAGQAVPSIGVLVLLAVMPWQNFGLDWSGIGFRWALVALVVYALLPVLRNTMVGLDGVDRSLIDAARGMGLTRTQVLRKVELPLAVPVMLAGIRIALILNVGVATLATFTNAGGLGDIIDGGIVQSRISTVVVTGSVLTAVLALAVDWLAGLAERLLRPRGL